MLWRYDKVPCNLIWTIHSVDIKTKNSGEYQVSFVRGKSQGCTDKLTFADTTLLSFDTHFETPCTMFIARNDHSSVRQKFLKITLLRFRKGHETKIYGKLSLDISKYYSKIMQQESIEMESGHGNAPVITLSVQLVVPTAKAMAAAVAEDEQSFLGDENERNPTKLEDWDAPSSVDKEKRKKHRKHKHSHSKSKSHSVTSEQSDVDEVRSESLQESEPEYFSEPNREPIDIQKPEEEPVKPDQPPEVEVKPPVVAEIKSDDVQPDIPDIPDIPYVEEPEIDQPPQVQEVPDEPASKPKAEPKPQAAKPPEAPVAKPELPAVEEPPQHDEQSSQAILHTVLTTEWPYTDPPVYFDTHQKVRVPGLLYPLVTVLRRHKVFDDEALTKAFYTDYPAPGKPEDNFIASIVLSLLFPAQAAALYPSIASSAKELTSPYLVNFEVISNRFATAKFHVDILIFDFCQVLGKVQKSLPFSPAVNLYLTRHFLALIDVRLVTKILVNPARFTYTNTAVWNSFSTAFEQVTHEELGILRQVVQAMLMGVNMSADPSLKDDIAPDLDPKTIAFILKNFKPDDLLPVKIEYKGFMDAYKVVNAVSYGDLKPLRVDQLQGITDGLKIDRWEAAKPNKVIPYLADE